MQVLSHRNTEEFVVYKEFNYTYLTPINKYVQGKLEENRWDDYNELYHAIKLVETVQRAPDLWMETHCLIRQETILGVLLILGGEIDKIETKYPIPNKNNSLLLKYFHIIEKGKGYGSHWLNSVVLPYYKERNYKQIYINSSHVNSFPFYQRLGSQIIDYQQSSDNGLYQRQGKSFLITL
ncbi:hypothetical protein H8B15_11490 [Hymenobacter sp. BT507]|uniref:GNAT family N-acetyltransferase n=1 Tax=Hymenobacter citatus TaxID=2763506 RepID=A0ABR7MKD6_9BACT|nr:hypothetical protein [Hymenobacter citatus]MBC6611552.1 hypothetical protein [Hymenobacter citatus]